MSSAWDPLDEFQRQVTRWLHHFEPRTAHRLNAVFPPLNLMDRGDAYVLVAEVPGCAAEEVEVSLSADMLILRGDRRRAEGVSDESYRRQERWSGRWSRSISLPERVAADRVTASCSDGRLVIVLPRDHAASPRRIQVSSEQRLPNGSNLP